MLTVIKGNILCKVLLLTGGMMTEQRGTSSKMVKHTGEGKDNAGIHYFVNGKYANGTDNGISM